MSVTIDELVQRLDKLPRIPLAHLPTPLEPMPRLSARLGGPQIYIKRDDLTGLAFGGNKTRHLEYLLADIAKTDADILVTGAYSQSNFCRQLTAAACKLGLSVSLVLAHGVKGPARQGNLLLDELMGAEITMVDALHVEDLPPYIEKKANALKASGRKPYVIYPLNIPNLSLSAIGYVNAAAEIAQQLQEQDLKPTALYVCGANMTPAGLATGFKLLDLKIPVVSIPPIHWTELAMADINLIGRKTAERLGLEVRLTDEDFAVHTGYVGPDYGILTDGAREAIRMLAQYEGIFLDPVYTAKAMAALIDHIRKEKFGKSDNIIFLHTGGLPGLFAYHDDLTD